MKSDTKISVEELVQLLFDRPTGLHIDQLEQALWKTRQSKEPVPKNFRSSIYGTLSLYSSQSLAFRQKKKTESQDLFFSPDGKGSGVWAVHRDRAEAWLRRRALLPFRHSAEISNNANPDSMSSGNRANFIDVRRTSPGMSVFEINRQSDL